MANDHAHEDADANAAGSQQRLQKIIAAAGIASRRKAEELITSGRVQINGQTVTELGTKADPARDHIRVDGKLLHGAERPRYFVLNKPKGYVTTASDPEGRPTVMHFFKGGERVFPVGRLDYSSEGLLLMTNDGDLANALTRAAARVEKTYLVKVSGKPSEAAIDQLRHGVMIDRGTQIHNPGGKPDASPRRNEGRIMTAPARIRLLRDADNPWYELILIEGRNREIRKMFEEIGHHVEKIRRVGYGPLVLDVEPGKLRELTVEEVAQLRRAAVSGAQAAATRLPRVRLAGARSADARPAGSRSAGPRSSSQRPSSSRPSSSRTSRTRSDSSRSAGTRSTGPSPGGERSAAAKDTRPAGGGPKKRTPAFGRDARRRPSDSRPTRSKPAGGSGGRGKRP